MIGENQNKNNNFYDRTSFSESISKRLEICNIILNRSRELTPEQKNQKLKERAKTIARQLQNKGGNLIIAPEGFLVTGEKGPLKDGELNRASLWVNKIISESEINNK